MFHTAQKTSPVKVLMAVFIITTTVSIPTVQGLITRKLDDSTTTTAVPSSPESSSPDSGGVDKCGSCPCNNPCPQNSPPPPPPPSPPPPPAKKPPPPPSGPYCPPPPPTSSGGFIYINGPPGNLYPIDPFFSDGGRSLAGAGGLLPVIGCGLVVGLLLAFG